MKKTPIEAMFASVKWKCTVCGEPNCDCFEKCSCGWFTYRGIFCPNPNTSKCSLKLKYGIYDRKKRKYVLNPECLMRALKTQEVRMVHHTVRPIVKRAWKDGLKVPYSVTLAKKDECDYVREQIAAINP